MRPPEPFSASKLIPVVVVQDTTPLVLCPSLVHDFVFEVVNSFPTFVRRNLSCHLVSSHFPVVQMAAVSLGRKLSKPPLWEIGQHDTAARFSTFLYLYPLAVIWDSN